MFSVKRNSKKENEFVIKGTLSLGKLIALNRALVIYSETSPVGKDVFLALQKALREGLSVEDLADVFNPERK